MSSGNTFDNIVALVTGGGSGIGRAVCLQLAREGARVLVTDLSLEAARETLSLLPNSGVHLALQMDVTQKKNVEGVLSTARDRFGVAPSLLVNSAGIGSRIPFEELEEDAFNSTIDVNLKGTFFVTQAFTRALLEGDQRAGEGKGAVVNISSMAGKTGLPFASHYAASKGGVISLTKSSAAELASKGIRVNCVLPALIDTPMASGISKESQQVYKSKNPLGRLGRPEEVAEVVVFLLSGRSSYMVGACVEVSGGTDM